VDMLRRCPVSSVLTSPSETARWEMDLNRISLGEETRTPFLANIKRFVIQAVNELKTAEFDLKNFKADVPAPAVVGNCPACGHQIKETTKAYTCGNQDCKFVIWKKIAGKTLSPRMAANLLKYRRSGPFKGFYSKKKKPFSASLILVQSEGQWQVSFDFAKPESASDSKPKAQETTAPRQANCPVCGGNIIEGKKGMGCANWRPEQGNCRFVIWKEISGKKLTSKNIAALLKGNTTRPYVLKDTKGNKFKAKLRMIQTTDKGFVIDILAEEDSLGGFVAQIPCSR